MILKIIVVIIWLLSFIGVIYNIKNAIIKERERIRLEKEAKVIEQEPESLKTGLIIFLIIWTIFGLCFALSSAESFYMVLWLIFGLFPYPVLLIIYLISRKRKSESDEE